MTLNLTLGLPWTSPVYTFTQSGVAVDLTGRSLMAEWREHNTGALLLTVTTEGGGIVIDDADGGQIHFVLTADDTDDLRSICREAHPGARRRFAVRVYDTDDPGDFYCDMEVVATP